MNPSYLFPIISCGVRVQGTSGKASCLLSLCSAGSGMPPSAQLRDSLSRSALRESWSVLVAERIALSGTRDVLVMLIGKLHHYMYIHDYFGCAVLLCLVVCLTLLASSFLPSHLSLSTSPPPPPPTQRDLRLPPDFPSDEVWQAYLGPEVDESREELQWGMPDLDLIRKYPVTKYSHKTPTVCY